MSIDKSDVKVGAAHEIGCRLDDALEALTKEMYRSEGAVVAFQQAANMIETLIRGIDREIDEEKMDLETAKLVKTRLDRARTMMSNQALSSESNKYTQAGKVQAMQAAVSITKKFKDEEMTKAQNLRAAYVRLKEQLEAKEETVNEAAVESEKAPRPVGMRPGLSIKERRRLEEASPAAGDNQKNSEEKTVEELSAIKEETPKSKVKRQKK